MGYVLSHRIGVKLSFKIHPDKATINNRDIPGDIVRKFAATFISVVGSDGHFNPNLFNISRVDMFTQSCVQLPLVLRLEVSDSNLCSSHFMRLSVTYDVK